MEALEDQCCLATCSHCSAALLLKTWFEPCVFAFFYTTLEKGTHHPWKKDTPPLKKGLAHFEKIAKPLEEGNAVLACSKRAQWSLGTRRRKKRTRGARRRPRQPLEKGRMWQEQLVEGKNLGPPHKPKLAMEAGQAREIQAGRQKQGWEENGVRAVQHQQETEKAGKPT